MTRTFDAEENVVNRARRDLVAVSGDPERAELMDRLMHDPTRHDVIFVESPERAYSRIKQVAPEVIVVLTGTADIAVCRLLSMLTIDCDTRSIPLITWITRGDGFEDDDFIEERMCEPTASVLAVQTH